MYRISLYTYPTTGEIDVPRKRSTPSHVPGRPSAWRTSRTCRAERTGLAGSRQASVQQSYPACAARAPAASAWRRPDACSRSAPPRAEDVSPASCRPFRSEPGERRIGFDAVADPFSSFPDTIPDPRAFRPTAPHRTCALSAICSSADRNRRDAAAPRPRRAGCPASAAAREADGARLAPFAGPPRKKADSPPHLSARRGSRDRGPDG